MAVGIIFRGVLTLFIGGILSFVVIPAMYNLKTDAGLWNGVSAEAITQRDNLYALFQFMPITIAGSTIVWMFVSATRHDPYEY